MNWDTAPIWLLLVAVLARIVWLHVQTQRIYKRMEAADPPICADTGAPKWPGNCWNVRCQLGNTCCRAAGVPGTHKDQS